MIDPQSRRYKRRQRKKQGVCSECGKPLDDPKRALCARCRETTVKRVQRFRSKDKN